MHSTGLGNRSMGSHGSRQHGALKDYNAYGGHSVPLVSLRNC